MGSIIAILLFSLSLIFCLLLKYSVIYVFILIGMITALWRASGTIAFIVYMGSKLISPSILTISSNCFKNMI